MVSGKQAASRPGIFGALVQKFFANVAKSPGLLACCLFPALFLLVFRFVVIEPVAHDDARMFLLVTGMLFSTSMVPGTTTVYPMAEAREKRTLRTMELAGVGRAQMVAAHGVVSTLWTALVAAACFLVSGAPFDCMLPFMLVTVATSIPLTALSLVLGLPLGVLLVVGEKNGVLPLPTWLLHVLNVIINLLRSIPFLILMIMVFPLSRLLIGTAVGTTATIVPLVVAAFPFVARLVETSLREVDGNIIAAAQIMGATPLQIICKVMIPESVPSLLQNFTIALTTILGYSAMSGIIGGGGLGKIAIDYGYYRYKYLVMFAAVVLLIILVQIFQSLGTHLAAKSDKRLKK